MKYTKEKLKQLEINHNHKPFQDVIAALFNEYVRYFTFNESDNIPGLIDVTFDFYIPEINTLVVEDFKDSKFNSNVSVTIDQRILASKAGYSIIEFDENNILGFKKHLEKLRHIKRVKDAEGKDYKPEPEFVVMQNLIKQFGD